MKWTFSEEDLIEGKVEYSVEQFRHDLRMEVDENFKEYSAHERENMFLLAYDVCYCLATRRNLQELVEHWRSRGEQLDLHVVELIAKANSANSSMLNALFAKKVSDMLKSGITREDALKKLDEYHAEITGKTIG